MEADVLGQLKRIVDDLKKQGIDFALEEEEEFFGPNLTVNVPNGNDTRSVLIYDSNVDQYTKFDFRKYVYLSDYDAICSYKEDFIEASIQAASGLFTSVLQKITVAQQGKLEKGSGDESDGEEVEDDKIPVNIELKKGAVRLLISPASEDFLKLVRGRPGLTMKILGSGAQNHDEATRALEKLAHSFSFSLSTAHDVDFVLTKKRTIRRRFRRGTAKDFQLKFPAFEYDGDPMSLYWYSKRATGMPLLQFLSLYQVLEFYFPVYAAREASRRIRIILKDPNFRIDRDSDITKLISANRLNRSGGLGSERDQLKATINECVTSDELREFFNGDQRRMDFFGKKHTSITSIKVPLDAKTDPREAASLAIYDIRCKIVHTKGEGSDAESGRILPFSKEAEMLDEYINLLNFLAQKALIAASSPISI